MHQRPVILVLVLLFECIAAERALRGLDLTDVQPLFSALCCPLDDNDQPCVAEQCPVADTQPGNIVDGNALTEWVVNFLSNGSSDVTPIARFALSFGQSYMLQSVTLLSTMRFLPRMWSLTASSGSTMEYSNDGVFEQTAILERNETFLQTSILQLSVGLPTSGDPISIAELVITIKASELPEEFGCGVCLEPLDRSLDELITTLENVSLVSQLNQTFIQLLITEVELDVGEYEDSLLVLAVVLGTNPPLDDDIVLSSAVSRIDLELVPPIPDKLEQLRQLVDSAASFEFDLGLLLSQLDRLEMELGEVEEDHRDLLNILDESVANLTQLIETLREVLTAHQEVEEEVFQVLQFIFTTNFSREEEDLRQYESMVESSRNASLELYNMIVLTDEQAKNTSASLARIATLLQQALDIIDEVVSRSNASLGTIGTVNDAIAQLEFLEREFMQQNDLVSGSIEEIRSQLNRALELIQATNSSLQLALGVLADLDSRLSQLTGEVEEFSLLLSPYRLPPLCNLSLPCTNNEIHAEQLSLNASELINSSVSIHTLRRARAFLESIVERGELFDYSLVNEIAIRAQSIAQDASDQVFASEVSDLLDQVRDALMRITSLREQSITLAATSNRTLRRVNSLTPQLFELDMQLKELQESRDLVRNRTASLRRSTGLRVEAEELLLQAREARNITMETDARVAVIGVGPTGVDFVDVANATTQTRENTLAASEALIETESKFKTISNFLNSTRDQAVELVFNTTAFISENERLIDEINSVISGLADIHSRLNKINSPVQLLSMDGEMPYLSLQPPPERSINDNILFESIDLYLWTSSEFRLPSMLFYAGPIYHEETDSIEAAVGTNNEDYFLLTVEVGDVLQLRWSLGGVVGTVTSRNFNRGFSQIVVTRHGSQFQLRYGVTIADLSLGETDGTRINGSVLFRVSPRTAFLLGGWPEGAQLGVPSSIIRLSDYNTFQGQFQLFIFNGRQWGLWNIRSASSTDLIGSFQSNQLANSNIWPSSISFDGSGYLFVSSLSDIQDFSGRRTMQINTLPSDERDGLVLYAYDETLKISMEMAFTDGNLRFIIRAHDLNLTLVDYPRPGVAASRRINLIFIQGVGFLINSQTYLDVRAIFFDDLTKVKVWFGGVRRDLLQSSYAPVLSNASYYGCVSMEGSANSITFQLLRGQFFISSFLNSPIQKGFSGTCLQSVYALEVGFDGSPEAFLSYRYLLLNLPNNHPNSEVVGSSVDGASVISFSFLTQRMEGVLLAAIATESIVSVVLSDGIVSVRIENNGGGLSVLTSSERVEIGMWQEFLLELRSDTFNLYQNGLLQDSQPSLLGFTFQLITTLPTTTDSVIFIGGSSATVTAPIVPANISLFTGCMKNFVFNYNAMGFLNLALPDDRRYPEGVSYHTCPFFNEVLDPLLAVLQETPQERVCLASAPLPLQGTHGGFHRETSLFTSNVIDLMSSSWTISLSVRQMGDGHVMSIGSTEGHMIRLFVRDGAAMMSLQGDGTTELAIGDMLDEGVFKAVDIDCRVNGVQQTLSCLLSVAGVPSGVGRLEVPYTVSNLFLPRLPLVFGKTEEMQSFVGCIIGLAINGKVDGFVNVKTDVECFNKTQPGLGFLGLSRISTLLSGVSAATNNSHTVTIEYQTQLENGLLLVLSDSSGSSPVLGVGMFNGQLRISDLTTGNADTHTTLATVCDPANPSRFNFTLTYGSTFVEVVIIRVGGSSGPMVTEFPFSPGEDQLLLSVGNTPRDLIVPEGLGVFEFLLSDERPTSSLPPGLVGCVTDVRVDGNDLTLTGAIFEEVLDGFCPSS